MLDPAALVDLAYESLIDARTATLLIEGVGRVGADMTAAITLCERAGRPVLLCPTSGEPARVAADGCAAVLTVPTPALAETAGTVIFLGRLQPSGTYGSGTERTTMLELAPVPIVIEPEATGAGHEHVDLPCYTAHCRRRGCRVTACPPMDTAQLRQIAERIRVHSNKHHQTQLVDAVTRLAGCPRDSVAGARLADLDPSGLLLDWTDETGGHRLPLSFTSPATDPSALSTAVREALEGADDGAHGGAVGRRGLAADAGRSGERVRRARCAALRRCRLSPAGHRRGVTAWDRKDVPQDESTQDG